MSFRSKLTICMTVIVTIMFGLGGAFLIMLSFDNSLKTEEENAFANYKFLCSTLLMANSISEKKDEFDVADVLKQVNANSDKEKVRLYDEKKQYYKSVTAYQFNDELRKKCTEDSCAMIKANYKDRYYIQVTG